MVLSRRKKCSFEPLGRPWVEASPKIEIQQYQAMIKNLEKGLDIRAGMNKLYLSINSLFIVFIGYLFQSNSGENVIHEFRNLIPLMGIIIIINSSLWLWQITKYFEAESARFDSILWMEDRLGLDGYVFEERILELREELCGKPHPYKRIECIEKLVCSFFIAIGVFISFTYFFLG